MTQINDFKFKWKDPNADFFSAGVTPGQYIEFFTDYEKTTPYHPVIGHTGKYRVWGLIDGQTLWVYPVDSVGERLSPPIDVDDTYASPVFYTIYKQLTKEEQVEELIDIAESYSNKRIVMLWPDVVIMEDHEGNYVEAPGYYLAAAVAGLIAGLPPQYPFSGLGISGIHGVKHSNDYFSYKQIDNMAKAGIFPVVQENENAVPNCYHQSTTDISRLETFELSLVKDLDWFSKFVKKNIKPFTRNGYNVYEDTIKSVENTAIACIRKAEEEFVVPKAGPVLISGELVAVRANLGGENNQDLTKDQIEVIIDAEPPYPLNKITLRIRV